MRFKIYQAYYNKQQMSLLDPEFEPLDNTLNPFPEQREYPVLLECHRRAQQEGLDAWGYFSWRWREKLSGLTGRDILNLVKNNPNYDVYVFNPQAEFSVACVNVWEHGQYYHPKLMSIMKRVYPMMGLDNELYQLAHPNTMFFSQYCLATCEFWQGYFQFLDKYIKSLDLLDPETLSQHNSSAEYARDFGLGYFPFILERLLPSYLSLTRSRYKIFAHHHHNVPQDYIYDKLYFLKTSAIKYQDQDILYEWLAFRNHIRWYLTLGQNWKINLS
jgi:hypothetical protein